MLSYAAIEEGEYRRAQEQVEQAVSLFRELSDQWGIAYTLLGLARVVLLQGNAVIAQTLTEESLDISFELHNWVVLHHAWSNSLKYQQRRTTRMGSATRGAAENLRETTAISLESTQEADYERAVNEVRNKLGEDEFRSMWLQGRRMTPEQAIAA